MFRYVFLLTLLVPACTKTEVKVTKVTPDDRFGADVYVYHEWTANNGKNTWSGRQHGLKVADDLVLTDARAKHGSVVYIRYTDRDRVRQKVGGRVIAEDTKLDLVLVRTEAPMNTSDASFMFIHPKVGSKVFSVRFSHRQPRPDEKNVSTFSEDLQEGIVSAVEWRPDGIRLRVLGKGGVYDNFENGEAIFDGYGRVIGIAKGKGWEPAKFDGYGDTDYPVIPSERIWPFIKAGREMTKAL